MRLLLDTHALLWHHEGSDMLSAVARDMIADTANHISISVATIWEISIDSAFREYDVVTVW